MDTTIPDPTIKILVGPFARSPDLGCVGAQRIIFPGRFLVYPTHLLPGGPRSAGIWLNLDLARSRCPDSENHDTASDNSL